MILYTPLSTSDIFPEEDEDFSSHKFVSFQGKKLYVKETDKGTYQLVQLLSTDPQDYLNDNYTPGNIFKK